MIIKNKDERQEQIDYLSDLLDRDFAEAKKAMIERELKCLYSGKMGEKSSAYYLDFEFKRTKNWALIHDLRLEHEGDVAQVDHLLIGRFMDIYVIESKNFTQGVSVSGEGDFHYFYKNRPNAIPSPITQNERHIRFLKRFLKDKDLLPKRLGVTLQPNFKNIVLISPKSRLTKPKKGTYDCSPVMKADKFFERFSSDLKDESFSSMMNVAKIISQESLRMFAERLALAHKPITIDYKAKFGLTDEIVPENPVTVSETPSEYIAETPDCPKCGQPMIRRTAKKGKNAGKTFWGCSQYPKCRGTIKDEDTKVLEPPIAADAIPECPKCGDPMVKRVAKKGDNAGAEFWGCAKYPKCRATITID